MLDSKDTDRLWRRIGINGQGSDRGTISREQEVQDQMRSKTSGRSVYSSVHWEESYKNKEETTPASNSLLDQPPFAPPSMPSQSGQQQLWGVEQSHPHPRMIIPQEESQIEQILHQRQDTIDYEDLQAYNEEMSQMPESITPLVYSKNSRKDDVRFNKQTAKAIILKIRLAETKDLLQRVRQDFINFASKVKNEHQTLHQQICNKYFQLARAESLRVQESVFMHKQDCQQLKYQLEVIKAKEQLMRTPVDSELFINNSPIANQLKIENDDLRVQLANITAENIRLSQENLKLTKEGQNFKLKIADIEAKTLQIRQSNDKLYQYIFDMEQKMAFYQEQIPKISQQVKEETQKRMELEYEQQSTAHYEQMNRNLDHIDMLQAQAIKMTAQIKRYNDIIAQFQSQNTDIKIKLEQLEINLKDKQLQLENKNKQTSAQENQIKKLKNQIQRLIKEREEVEQWKEEQRRESNSRLSRAYSIKEDKKLIQNLEIEKLVLQKENIQLKATIEFYNKNQNYAPNYLPQKSYAASPYQIPSMQNQQIDQKDKQLEMKERQLISLQNYLEDEARRLDNKQRDIQSQYVLKRAQETRVREYIQPTRINPLDDYGMKKLPIAQSKPIQQPRRNHFCSSQTQAIIEKVKMRQKMKENGCICNETRNCHCDAHSRGSRTSQDSNSRDYLRMQHHRPSNYSPGLTGYEYMKRQQKSSKMKLIQDKVRRLKSELKSSFTTMNN